MFAFFGRIPIFHLASMARCGETVLLRSLAAHSQIHVVHNLYKLDSAREDRLFRFLQCQRRKAIWRLNKHVRGINTKPGQVLLLKQSVWEHKFPFNGFILVRNPFSLFASLKFYDVPRGITEWEMFWPSNTNRFKRWLTEIDPDLILGFEALDPIDQFCSFFNRRMGKLRLTGLPVVHYEDFVVNPASVLDKILKILGLEREHTMLESHTAYPSGTEGHGKIDLSKPISTRSLYKYSKVLSNQEFDRIKKLTDQLCRDFGYEIELGQIHIDGTSIPAKNEL